MSMMELDGFGYKMKEFHGVFMGLLLSYRIRIKGGTKDIKTKDPNTKAKVVVGNRMILEYQKMELVVSTTKDKNYLHVMISPKKPDKYISDEFIDLVNECLVKAREKMIEKENKQESDFEAIVLTKLSALAKGDGSGGAVALTCSNCKAPLPPVKHGNVVCPYCDTTNVL